jgi:hypothetical protein
MATFFLPDARTALREATGEDEDTLPDATCDVHLNMSLRALLDTYAFREKEVTATFNTGVGQQNYEMPDPYDALRQISIFDSNSNESHRVDPMSVDEWTQKFIDTVDARGFPTRYVRESCLFRLWPVPDQAYRMVIKYWGILADLSNTKQSIDIPAVWWPAILDGGIVNVFKYKQGDVERAAAYTRFQAKVISDIVPTQVKEEEDYHRAGVAPYINREL